ncbi:MAG: hypothetical protein U1E60_08015 [Reyranellaceae bacterium]
MTQRGTRLAALSQWLAEELGDAEIANQLAHFIVDDVMTWRSPGIDPTGFKTIIAFTFGNRMSANGNRSPGPVNEAIARAAAEVQRSSDSVVYAQWEVAEALAPILPGARIVPIHPDRDARAEPVYLGTQAVIRRILEHNGGPAALGTVGIVAFRDHLRRCVSTARALGLDAHAPAGVTMPEAYDPQSGQPWCRSRIAYLLHDLAVGAAERRDMLCVESKDSAATQ